MVVNCIEGARTVRKRCLDDEILILNAVRAQSLYVVRPN